MKRVLIIDKCQDCNIENCNLRTMCGLIPDECPLQKDSEAQKTTSWDDAVKELQECRTYVMAYDPLLCDGMDLHVSGKFPNCHVAKWIKEDAKEGESHETK